jgi:hypothetical protein
MVTQWHLLKETTAFTSTVWSGWQVLRVGNVNEKLQGDEVNTLAHLCGGAIWRGGNNADEGSIWVKCDGLM